MMLFSVFKLTCWIRLTFLPQTDCLISVCTLHCLVTLNQVLSAHKGRQTPRSGYLWTPGPHLQLFYLNQVGAGSCPGHNLSPSGPPLGEPSQSPLEASRARLALGFCTSSWAAPRRRFYITSVKSGHKARLCPLLFSHKCSPLSQC